MISFNFIHGLSVGLEYSDTEDLGFIVNLDLGIFRLTWFRDLEIDDE
jgi:hypothetical protein